MYSLFSNLTVTVVFVSVYIFSRLMNNSVQFYDIMMNSTAQILSSTTSLSDALHDSFIEIARKRRRTRTHRNATSGLNHLISPIQSPKKATEPTDREQGSAESTIDLMHQWENETLVLVYLAKGYKGLRMKSTTGRNIIKAHNQKTIETLSNLKSMYGKSIRFIKLDPSKKILYY